MTIGIRLDGSDLLGLVGDLHNSILFVVQMDKSRSLGGNNADLDILIGQTGAEIAEPNGDEITFAPILYQSLGVIIVVLQSTRDFSP